MVQNEEYAALFRRASAPDAECVVVACYSPSAARSLRQALYRERDMLDENDGGLAILAQLLTFKVRGPDLVIERSTPRPTSLSLVRAALSKP